MLILLNKNEFKAPAGMFRVIAVCTKLGVKELVVKDCVDEQEAIKKAREKSDKSIVTHVYNSDGEHLHEFGKF